LHEEVVARCLKQSVIPNSLGRAVPLSARLLFKKRRIKFWMGVSQCGRIRLSEAGFKSMPQGFTATLDQFADWLARPEFSEHMLACLHDGGCPNLDKASQNRAMRGIRQPDVLE